MLIPYGPKSVCQCTGNIVLLAQNLQELVLRYFSPFFLRMQLHPHEIPEGTEDPLETAGTCEKYFVV